MSCLKLMICGVLGISEFDESVFLEKIDRIIVNAPDRLTFVMKDGNTEDRIWNFKKEMPGWTAEHRRHYEKAKEMNENGEKHN